MPEISDFLNPGLDQIRNSIRDIDESYSHEWDILAELCQNAVDSINKLGNTEGLIEIEVNAQEKLIRVRDNGTGISPERLPILLKPFATDKRADHNSIGEKGVGLTFVMFSGDNFVIKSGNNNGTCWGRVRNAKAWKNNADDEILNLEIETNEDAMQGTEVTVSGVDNTNIFALTIEQLKYVLRTKTAIGNTLPLWGEDSNISVSLIHTDLEGVKQSVSDLPFQYLLPYEILPREAKLDYANYVEFASDPNKTDFDKRNFIRDKVVYKTGSISHSNNRVMKYVACFVPSRKTWNVISKTLGLATEELLENDEWLDNYGYSLAHAGILTSVKGMPTGITIDHPSTGFAGYWSNIFILFEDSQLSFDIGRKSINGRQASVLKDDSKTIFNDFLRLAKYMSGEAEPNLEWERDDVFNEIEQLPNLRYNNIKMIKTPKDQEAGVAALFYECIGNGIITDLQPLVSGYKNKYDLYAKWGNKKQVIEFKARLKNIAKDFNDAQKLFDEINCIVCWDVSEEDHQVLMSKLGIDLEAIAINPLAGPSASTFPNATHKLVLSGFTKPLYVIDLKKVLDSKIQN